MRTWTVKEIRALGVHTDVETAASVLGMGRSKAYTLIRSDEFPVPVLRLGGRIRVPIAGLLEVLGIDASDPPGR